MPFLVYVFQMLIIALRYVRGEIGVSRNGPVVLFDAEHPDGVDSESIVHLLRECGILTT